MRSAGFIAGLLIAAATLISRFALAETHTESITAVALSFFELAAVLYLESAKRGIQPSVKEWQRKKATYDEAQARIAAARAEAERREAHLRTVESKLAQHHAHVEERGIQSATNGYIVEACIQAITDGYNEGIEFNRGRLLGAGE